MRILAVDDDPVILDVLGEVLSSFGYTNVTFASSGQDGLTILQNDQQGFDTLLFDIQMPHMDGITLTKLTRDLYRYKDVPILMLTAMSDKVYVDRAFQAGATDYVTKPFETFELRSRMCVAKRLADEQKKLSDVITSVRNIVQQDRQISVEDPYSVQELDCMIPLPAFHNYLKQLGRGSLFSSSLVAFKIENIERLYRSMSDYEYICALTDAADAISTALPFRQFLMTHAGNGKFICVAEGVNRELIDSLPTDIAHVIEEIDPCYGDGRPLMLSVLVGEPIPLRFRGGDAINRAITSAVTKVEHHSISVPSYGQQRHSIPLFRMSSTK
ncbi:response regulator [Litoreibacter halocynthiae]|uniref:response regulator n=1 Tax=Litoreibacter halocynthiae TaxID=1242689 RepID=UPI002490A5F9|nr:response regulator [Litoreibacter halocynthiae]